MKLAPEQYRPSTSVQRGTVRPRRPPSDWGSEAQRLSRLQAASGREHIVLSWLQAGLRENS